MSAKNILFSQGSSSFQELFYLWPQELDLWKSNIWRTFPLFWTNFNFKKNLAVSPTSESFPTPKSSSKKTRCSLGTCANFNAVLMGLLGCFQVKRFHTWIEGLQRYQKLTLRIITYLSVLNLILVLKVDVRRYGFIKSRAERNQHLRGCPSRRHSTALRSHQSWYQSNKWRDKCPNVHGKPSDAEEWHNMAPNGTTFFRIFVGALQDYKAFISNSDIVMPHLITLYIESSAWVSTIVKKWVDVKTLLSRRANHQRIETCQKNVVWKIWRWQACLKPLSAFAHSCYGSM